MASFIYNAGAHAIDNGDFDFLTATVKVMLLGLSTPYTPDKDHDHIDDINASELAVSGYAGGFAGAGRKTLANKAVTQNTGTDRDMLDADDPSAWTLAAGDSVTAAVVYFHLTSDAVSVPLAYLDFTDVVTNGGAFNLAFDALGIGYSQQ